MRRHTAQFVPGFLIVLLACLAAPHRARTQDLPPDPSSAQSTPTPADDSSSDEATTLFPHSESSRFWISGQANIVFQAHPAFPAAYSGPNSLRATAENATSSLLTLYTGVELTHTTEFLFDEESTGGRGLSEALGLAGFTDLDVVRNPGLGSTPYVARLMLHQVIPLSHETVNANAARSAC